MTGLGGGEGCGNFGLGLAPPMIRGSAVKLVRFRPAGSGKEKKTE